MNTKVNNLVDAHIGGRMRARREALRLKPAWLAARLGVAEHTILAYERGQARISAAMLAQLCAALETTLAYFFDDLPPAGPAWVH